MKDDLFIHLRTHSAYSLLEGALHVGQIIDLAVKDRQPAVAVTDTNNLFSALEFSQKAAGKGLQPIVGVIVPVDFSDEDTGKITATGRRTTRQAPLVLLATSETGFLNLSWLLSDAYMTSDGASGIALTLDGLRDRASDVIALTGGVQGPIGLALEQGDDLAAMRRLEQLQALFGDRLYVELQRHGMDGEKELESAFVDLAYRKGVPLVATNDCHFARADDFEAHDALLAVADGQAVANPDRRRLTPRHAFRSRADMIAEFADLPEAVASTIEIARRVSWRPRTCAPMLPGFTGDNKDEEAVELARQARKGLEARLAAHGMAPGKDRAVYDERLEYELSIITRMGFPGYFLIVADFIQWAKDQGIPVGPGRGSGAGSLVAWVLLITDLDPLRFNLLFERFLNPERVSMPDFDIDFCQERRDEVIAYVQERYGKDKVAQIITFGSLQARAVLRDVGRVLGMPYGQVDRLCKMVPANPANPVKLKDAIEGEPRLQQAAEEEEIVGKLLDVGMRLEGLYRHASTHAAGIVIADRPLPDLVPVYRDPRSDMPVTQYNMKWVEQAGLVKFDFLGLKTLTVLRRAVDILDKLGTSVDLGSLPLDDPATYALYSRGETVGVFQVESAGMRRMLLEMKPDRFEDIIALVALYRPGPMENIPTFNARKHGREKPDYPHPDLEPILAETFGIIVYQEQVMQIAQVLSGYSLGEADLLRRAMGKKIREEMEKQKKRFVDGAVERGTKAITADSIFELVQRFANYGFNKSHAAAYALVSYQTAFMKANYPVAFMAASMALDSHNTDKLSDFRSECRRMKIDLRPPCINLSGASFEVEGDAVRYALGAIKGVGMAAAEHIVEMREAGGPFKDVTDVARRINPRIVNRKCLESLIHAGVMDRLEPNRAALSQGLDRLMSEASRHHEDSVAGQGGLFGDSPVSKINLPDVDRWTGAELLAREHAAIGFYFSAHPLDSYQNVLDKLNIQTHQNFCAAVRRGLSAGRLAGTVLSRTERATRKGNKMGIVRLTDGSGEFEAVMFAEVLDANREALAPGRSVVLMVSASAEEEDVRLRIQGVQSLQELSERNLQRMRVYIEDAACLPRIEAHLKKGSGDGDVSLIVFDPKERCEIEVHLPGGYKVSPLVASALKAIRGVANATVA